MALTQAQQMGDDVSGMRDPTRKPCVVFVDDEKRVLNSMRALFRREYDLHLTTSGEEAIRLCVEHDADVIVADQRMPEMEGVEVLGAVREQAPRTMRILLTGYADLDAIEGSINVGEVFRFLSKPCAPEQLRKTIDLAIKASEVPMPVSVPAPQVEALAPDTSTADPSGDVEVDLPDASLLGDSDEASKPKRKAKSLIPAMLAKHQAKQTQSQVEEEPPAEDRAESTGEQVILSGDRVEYGSSRESSFQDMESVGVVVFTLSDTFYKEVERATGGHYKLYHANRLLKVLELITQKKAGVLISEVSSEGSVLRKVLNKFKQHLPELIAIVVSDDRDAAEMISLINQGQVFRYMAKPISHDRLLQNINGGALRHLQLLANPSLIPRMAVEASEDGDDAGGSPMTSLFSRIRSIGKIWQRNKD
ncbi:MAG: response regulator [Pseudomonadota bacterium]